MDKIEIIGYVLIVASLVLCALLGLYMGWVLWGNDKDCERRNSEKYMEIIKKLVDDICYQKNCLQKLNSEITEELEQLNSKIYSYLNNGSGYIGMTNKQSEIDEKKPADKVEPKFKAGDYVVGKYISGYISEVRDDCYLLDYQGFSIDKQDDYHLWTIQDAKDGDVLASGGVVFIFNKIHSVWLNCHCSEHNDGSFIAESYDLLNKHLSEVYPATKEQHDKFFAKMKEAGYKWDAEKKELKKIDDKK